MRRKRVGVGPQEPRQASLLDRKRAENGAESLAPDTAHSASLLAAAVDLRGPVRTGGHASSPIALRHESGPVEGMGALPIASPLVQDLEACAARGLGGL